MYVLLNLHFSRLFCHYLLSNTVQLQPYKMYKLWISSQIYMPYGGLTSRWDILTMQAAEHLHAYEAMMLLSYLV